MKQECKKYLDLFLPMKKCNLNCTYCYVEGKNNKDVIQEPIKYTSAYIAKCLSKSRLGGCCIINLCSDGETLLHPDTFNIVKQLLQEGHFVSVVTNGTFSNKIAEYLNLPTPLLGHLFFKFSFHYLELKRLNLLDKFFENINLVKASPASFTVELPASDDFIPYINEIKQISINKIGALPHVTVLRDDTIKERPILTQYPVTEYRKIWEEFDSELFNIRFKSWGKSRKDRFCYAGYFTGCINLENGEFIQCYLDTPPYKTNVLENPIQDFPIKPIGFQCPEAHCRVCHAFLAFGDLPEIETPTYAILRNRKCVDGTEWLKDEVKQAFETKFFKTNPDYLEVKNLFLQKNHRRIGQKLFSLSLTEENSRIIFNVCGLKFKLRIKG